MNRTGYILVGITVAIMAAAIAVFVLPGKSVAPTAIPASKDDLIRVTSPLPYEKVTSPIVVRGEARGTWFFEATFPVEVYNMGGSKIMDTYAEAQGDWMTTEYVPFIVTINHARPADLREDYGYPIEIVLNKANASGLPEHDNHLSIIVEL